MSGIGTNLVSRFWEEVFNGGNLAAIDEIVAPGFVLHDLATRKDHDRDMLHGLIGTLQGSLPGTQAIIEEQLAAGGDRVVTRFTVRTPRPSSGGSAGFYSRLEDYEITLRIARVSDPAATVRADAGEWVDLSGMSISRVSQQYIEESWLIWETLRAELELGPPDTDWRWPPWR
jgi:hypothetical protein